MSVAPFSFSGRIPQSRGYGSTALQCQRLFVLCPFRLRDASRKKVSVLFHFPILIRPSPSISFLLALLLHRKTQLVTFF